MRNTRPGCRDIPRPWPSRLEKLRQLEIGQPDSILFEPDAFIWTNQFFHLDGHRSCNQTIAFHHFRDKDGVEVDLVLAKGGRLCGVEVKAGSTVKAEDFRGLRKLKDAVGHAFVRGVVLYDGEAVIPFGDALQAVPISLLWTSNP